MALGVRRYERCRADSGEHRPGPSAPGVHLPRGQRPQAGLPPKRTYNPGKLNTAISQTDTQTTAGLIKFNQSTHTAITPSYITQWQNGKLIQVQPLARGVTFDVPTAGLG
jgi:hypothetical protein